METGKDLGDSAEELMEEFEHWFLGLSYDFGREALSRCGGNGKYFYITTQQLFTQFCKIKELEGEVEHWKANHSDMVKRNAELQNSSDLQRDKLSKENENLRQHLYNTLYVLLRLQVGSCTCLTKSPEVQDHAYDCKYRFIKETTDMVWEVLKSE